MVSSREVPPATLLQRPTPRAQSLPRPLSPQPVPSRPSFATAQNMRGPVCGSSSISSQQSLMNAACASRSLIPRRSLLPFDPGQTGGIAAPHRSLSPFSSGILSPPAVSGRLSPSRERFFRPQASPSLTIGTLVRSPIVESAVQPVSASTSSKPSSCSASPHGLGCPDGTGPSPSVPQSDAITGQASLMVASATPIASTDDQGTDGRAEFAATTLPCPSAGLLEPRLAMPPPLQPLPSTESSFLLVSAEDVDAALQAATEALETAVPRSSNAVAAPTVPALDLLQFGSPVSRAHSNGGSLALPVVMEEASPLLTAVASHPSRLDGQPLLLPVTAQQPLSFLSSPRPDSPSPRRR